jgi:hypothetical protein
MCPALLPLTGREAPDPDGLRGEMSSRKWVVVLAIAAGVLLADVRALEAPETGFKHSEYVRDHKIIPVPIMGIRGTADVLKIAPGV